MQAGQASDVAGNGPAKGGAAAAGGAGSGSGSGSAPTSGGRPSSQRRHPSLGNLTSQHANPAASGPSPVTPTGPVASPGVFSFAAAASGQGANASSGGAHSASSGGGAATSVGTGTGNSGLGLGAGGTSSSNQAAVDADSLRYSRRLLSLYSSERGQKSPSTSAAAQLSPDAPNGSGGASTASGIGAGAAAHGGSVGSRKKVGPSLILDIHRDRIS